eukprot:TRINITY_DN4015_c0_g1_i4.p2 TRINITY_DN4015_c0_g1~~TRINITY_DN4015_c0_g1_i4.p2  ORF type:complete len:123 (+),score=12.42 TRINITY_DN4015_c0_g1_i4:639-1007(+)
MSLITPSSSMLLPSPLLRALNVIEKSSRRVGPALPENASLSSPGVCLLSSRRWQLNCVLEGRDGLGLDTLQLKLVEEANIEACTSLKAAMTPVSTGLCSTARQIFCQVDYAISSAAQFFEGK